MTPTEQYEKDVVCSDGLEYRLVITVLDYGVHHVREKESCRWASSKKLEDAITKWDRMFIQKKPLYPN